MTVIRPNSISGVTSITALANEINVFKHDGILAGLQLNGVNHHTSSGVSTFHTLNVLGNVSVGGTLTYQDVTNVDSVGIITARAGVNVSAGQLDVGSNIKLGNAGVITATSFVGSGANLTGITIPGGGTGLDLDDNARIRLGTGNDLQIWHNGSESYISEAGTGGLTMYADHLKLQSPGGENMIVATSNAAVQIYHNNTLRFETRTNDVKFYDGLVAIDNAQIQLGNSGDIKLYHDGTNSYLDNVITGILRIRGNSSGQVEIQPKGGQYGVNVIPDAAVELYHSGTKKIETTSTGVTISGNANFANNNKAIFGTGNDAEIYHNDTDFVINAQASGATRNIYLYAGTVNEGGIYLYSSAGETMFKALTDSSCFLYFDNALKFRTMTDHCEIRGHLLPDGNNTYDIGSSSARFRNIYTNDLNLSNEGSTNSVDNTWGNYTIQEGESDLFLINNRNGKKYKFNLTEVN